MTETDAEIPVGVHLGRIARELKEIRELVRTAVNQLGSAEDEIPESMRRFVNYFHDLHDIKFVYEELGHSPPDYVLRELERCDDRFRQLLSRHHTGGGAFEKVRREMAEDPDNRWDHTKLLFKSKEAKDEARQSNGGRPVGPEGRAEIESSQP